jgi:uncharacterized membrane protein
MGREFTALAVHRAIVKHSEAYEKVRPSQKGGIYEYLAKHCRRLLPTCTDWKSALKRARAAVKLCSTQAKVKATAKAKAKATAKAKLKQAMSNFGAGLDEDEFLEDIGGWVVSVLLWVPMLHSAIGKVPNLCQGMQSVSSASMILEALGFGNMFVNQLVLRTLQPLGVCMGVIAKIGTGTHTLGHRLCGSTHHGAPSVPMLLTLYAALEPMLVWLIHGMLGRNWTVLVTFQLFQSLLCEKRKLEDFTRKRRDGWEERRHHFLEHLQAVCWALAFP